MLAIENVLVFLKGRVFSLSVGQGVRQLVSESCGRPSYDTSSFLVSAKENSPVVPGPSKVQLY